jgi:hypothetical protein
MNTKEIVDKYLLENFEEIDAQRVLNKEFRWQEVTNKIIGNLKLFIDPEYVRHRFSKLRKKQEKYNTPKTIQKASYKTTGTSEFVTDFFYTSGKENKQTGLKEWTFTASEIPTEEQIVEHFNIDTKKWKIVNIYHKTSFGGKYSITVQTNLLKGVESVNYIQAFEDFVDKKNTTILQRPQIDLPKLNRDEQVIVVINLADLHLGKLVSEHETGERYNLKIAKERFLECIKTLTLRSYTLYGVKKIILSTLGDTLHTDNLKSTTTSGTYVESDTRASKVFETALEIITEAIDICKQFAEEVEFININGNHCELSEQHLGVALKAYYRNDKSVKIDAEPKNRKYRLEGKNLLAWSHGDTNANNLPLTMATEQAEMWGKSNYRLMQLGHLHTSKKKVYQSEDEINGVVVRHFSSLSGTDQWHDKNCYVGNTKKGTALIFKQDVIGILAEINHTV